MKANINNRIENVNVMKEYEYDNTKVEAMILDGNFKGAWVVINKNDLIKKKDEVVRFKAEYEVLRNSFDYITKQYDSISSRCVSITIIGKSEENVSNAFSQLQDYMSNFGYEFSSCPTIEETEKGFWEYCDCIDVDSKSEANEVIECYKYFKKEYKLKNISILN